MKNIKASCNPAIHCTSLEDPATLVPMILTRIAVLAGSCGALTERRGLLRSLAIAAIIAATLQPLAAGALARNEPVWDSNNEAAAFEPQNRRGPTVAYRQMPPSAQPGVLRQGLEGDGQSFPANPFFSSDGALNGNFQLVVPIANFRGRGLDLHLALRYSSRVWARVGNEFVFDPDADWPAPGWSLGFGKLSRSLITDSDGTRHPLVWLDPLHARTSDGTRIDIAWPSDPTIPRRVIASYPDGHTVDFAEFANIGVAYPIRIADRNGNYMTIDYRGPNGAAISTVTDTVGRTITFQYDGSDRLTGVRGPGVNGATANYVSLYYRHLTSRFRLPNGRVDRLDDDVIEAILLPGPAGSNGYWFGDPNSYNALGMIRQVVWQTGMRRLGGGGFAQGRTVRTRTYALAPSVPAGDLPRYAAMTETWVGGPAAGTTRYDIRLTGSLRELETTYPDGTRVVEAANLTAGAVGSGLVYQTTVVDAANTTLARELREWEAGANGMPRVKWVERSDNADALRVEYRYGPNDEVIEIRELDYDGSVMRRVTTEYVAARAYEQRHIFSLPSVVRIFAGEATIPSARTDYFYDEGVLQPAPGALQHFVAFADPLMVPQRGNLTRIVRYADATAPSGPLEERRNYDVTGNVIAVLQGNMKTTFTRGPATQFALTELITTGSSAVGSPALLTESFEYDVPLGKVKAITNVDNVRTDLAYDGATLELNRISSIRTTTTYTQQDGGLTRTLETRDAAGTEIERITIRLDGRGRAVRTERLADGGITDVQDVRLDLVGRVAQRSMPYRGGSTDLYWISNDYDALNRPTRTAMPDGSESRVFYDEPQRPAAASANKGTTTRTVDRWGRERWLRKDALGRLVEVVEPNPDGDGPVAVGGALTTTYTYDVLGDLLRIVQGPQIRDFGYDALGRLRRQRLPERAATLDARGRYGGIPPRNLRLAGWSDVFAYDDLGRLASVTDARGVRTVYDYGADPLNRLQRLSYDTRSFGDTANAILPSPDVLLQYVASGDVRRLATVTVSGVATERYSYTQEGRLASKMTELSAFPAMPLLFDYGYDDAGRLLLTRYPNQWNAPTSARREVTYANGLAGRLRAMEVGSNWKVTVSGYEPSGLPSGWQWTTETEIGVPLGFGLDGWAVVPATFGVRESLTFDPRNVQEATRAVLPVNTAAGELAPLLQLSTGYERNLGTPGTTTPELAVLDPSPPPASAIGEQLTSETDATVSAGGREFSYDAVGRLVRAASGVTVQPDLLGHPVRSYQSAQEYRYDRFGNRLAVRAYGPPLPTECVTPPCVAAAPELSADQRDGWSILAMDPGTNHIVSAGFAYDAAGNLVSAPQLAGVTHRYTYDAAGRLVEVRDSQGQLIERHAYTYGRTRVGSFDNAGNGTIYGWSGDNVVVEYDASPPGSLRWRRSFISVGPQALGSFALEQGQEVLEIYSNDRAGPRIVTRANPQGALLTASRIETLPFGRRLPAGTFTSARYASFSRSQATGLDYANNRFYAPELGRFLETDPLGSGASDLRNPQTLNLYTYVQNDPMNRFDPLGLKDDAKECPEDEIYIPPQGCTPVAIAIGAHPPPLEVPASVPIDAPLGAPALTGRPPETSIGRSERDTSSHDLLGYLGVATVVLAASSETGRQIVARLFLLVNSLIGEPMQMPLRPTVLPAVRPVAPISAPPPPVPAEVEALSSRWIIVGESIVSRLAGTVFVNPCLVDNTVAGCGGGAPVY